MVDAESGVVEPSRLNGSSPRDPTAAERERARQKAEASAVRPCDAAPIAQQIPVGPGRGECDPTLGDFFPGKNLDAEGSSASPYKAGAIL
jgi:hypothetical protein